MHLLEREGPFCWLLVNFPLKCFKSNLFAIKIPWIHKQTHMVWFCKWRSLISFGGMLFSCWGKLGPAETCKSRRGSFRNRRQYWLKGETAEIEGDFESKEGKLLCSSIPKVQQGTRFCADNIISTTELFCRSQLKDGRWHDKPGGMPSLAEQFFGLLCLWICFTSSKKWLDLMIETEDQCAEGIKTCNLQLELYGTTRFVAGTIQTQMCVNEVLGPFRSCSASRGSQCVCYEFQMCVTGVTNDYFGDPLLLLSLMKSWKTESRNQWMKEWTAIFFPESINQ